LWKETLLASDEETKRVGSPEEPTVAGETEARLHRVVDRLCRRIELGRDCERTIGAQLEERKVGGAEEGDASRAIGSDKLGAAGRRPKVATADCLGGEGARGRRCGQEDRSKEERGGHEARECGHTEQPLM
jgi:hypothetical protein